MITLFTEYKDGSNFAGPLLQRITSSLYEMKLVGSGTTLTYVLIAVKKPKEYLGRKFFKEIVVNVLKHLPLGGK